MPIDYIIDANIIFSALMSGKVVYKTLFERYKCFSADYLFVEMERHKDIILKKTKMDTAQFVPYAVSLFSNIGIIATMLLSTNAKQEAIRLCSKVDIDDFIYIALSIDFNAPLVTRDETLYEGLRKQKFKNIVLLQDVIDTL